MVALYNEDGKQIEADKKQVPLMEKSGWMKEKPEVKEAEVDEKEEVTEVDEKTEVKAPKKKIKKIKKKDK